MVYGGAVAAGAFAGQSVVVFGWELEPGLPVVSRDRVRRNGRLHGRVDRGLVDRRARGPSVPRAPRPLVPSEGGEPTQGRALVRALGGLGGVLRPDHARRALVRVDSGGRLSRALSSLHRPDAARLRDLVLRPRRRRLGAREPVGGVPPLLQVRRLPDRCVDRGRRRVPRLEALPPGEPPLAPGRLAFREDRSRRCQGSVRAAHPPAQAGLRGSARERAVRLRPERRGVRARGGRVSRRAGDDRRRQRDGRDRASSSTPSASAAATR